MTNVGIGLPISGPGRLLEWAQRAEDGPFSTLGLLDRLVYDNPEPLVALAVIAGATSRIRVQTEVLLAPLRDEALLAKQAATLDRMTSGRLVLGLGVGGRDDDHQVVGVDLSARGKRLDEQLPVMRRIWAGEPYAETVGPIGPAPTTRGGPELLFGGFQPKALERVARWGDGVIAAAPPEWAGRIFDTVRTSWHANGREGEPRIVAQVNVALGDDDVIDQARKAMHAYYRFTGRADQMVQGLRTTKHQVNKAIQAYADLGAHEVMLYCYGEDPTQVDRLADLS